MTPTVARIAWRNLWRNRRRTVLAVAAISLSVTLVLALFGLLNAYGTWLVDAITGPMLGHVQIHAVGWRKDRSMDRTVGTIAEKINALRRDPEVAGASARIYAPALAALKEEGFTVLVIGIDSAAETGPARLLPEGSGSLGNRRILMGRPLAEVMGVREGDVLAVVGQGVDGSLANDLFTVAGLVNTPVDLVNREGILMELADAQALFAMSDEAHEILVHARDPEQVRALADTLAARADLRATEVLDWKTLAPEAASLIGLVQTVGTLVLTLVFVAAAAGVANTMLMATFERTHEFGMLLALGTGPWRLVWMIVAESTALGGVGAIVGVAIVAVTHITGVDFATLTGGGPSAISFEGLRVTLRFYPSLALGDIVRVVSAVVVTSLLASAWPAARVARVEPASALRA